MVCPNCEGDIKVLDTISSPTINHRHRKCNICGFDFYTQEKVVEPSQCDYLFKEWSRERRRKSQAKKKGIVYDPKFSDGREVKSEPKLPTKALF